MRRLRGRWATECVIGGAVAVLCAVAATVPLYESSIASASAQHEVAARCPEQVGAQLAIPPARRGEASATLGSIIAGHPGFRTPVLTDVVTAPLTLARPDGVYRVATVVAR